MVTENKRLAMAEETGGYRTDPSADGSGYTSLPVEELSFLKSNRTPIRTAYATGRPWPTRSIPGPDGGEFTCKVPLWGLLVSPAAAATPSVTLTPFERLLRHILGGARVVTGAAIAAATDDSISVTADVLAPQDLVPVVEAGVPADAPRAQWVHIDSETAGTPNVYEVSPAFEETPTAAAVARGCRIFTFDGNGGDTLAFYLVDDDEPWTCLGCRVTAAVIDDEPTQRAMMSLTIAYDSRVAGAKASIPDPVDGPPINEIVAFNSPVHFGETLIETAKTSLDFGILAEPIASRIGANGRAGHDVVHLRPTLTVNPMGGAAFEDLMHLATEDFAQIQYGGGPLAGGTLNSICVRFASAQVMEATREDDAGRRRVSFTIEFVDEVMFAPGVPSRALQVAVG